MSTTHDDSAAKEVERLQRENSALRYTEERAIEDRDAAFAALADARSQIAQAQKLLLDVGSIALATYEPQSGMCNIRIPDATWQAIRATVRAARSTPKRGDPEPTHEGM